MQFRRISTIALATVLFDNADVYGWLYIIPKEQLRDPLLCLAGNYVLKPSAEVPTPILGYYVNSASYYYFAGNTAKLNRYLSRCVDPQVGKDDWYSQIHRKIVVHAGAGFAEKPGRDANDDSIEPRAQWKLGLVPEIIVKEGQPSVHELHLVVDIWIDETIKVEDLVVPDGFEIALGDELKRVLKKDL